MGAAHPRQRACPVYQERHVRDLPEEAFRETEGFLTAAE